MWEVGVWEPEEPMSPLLVDLAEGAGCLIRACCAPHPTWNTPLDLLVVAPHGPRAVCLPRCRAALVPGDVTQPQCAAPPPIWVSYGCASCNTLTLSSLTAHSAAVAVQREFPHLGGGIVERQELVLPYSGPAPLPFLAQVGTALLLGLLP